MAKLRGLPAALALLLACDAQNGIGPRPAADQRAALSAPDASYALVPAAATGGGHYALPGLDVQFAFSAVLHGDGRATGQFHHEADEGGGLFIDLSGEVTCLAVDPVNHRAWIGGVITKNTSTDPDLLTDIQQPGHDIWFRVLDAGEGASATDRTTFTGFEGSAGIQTSAQYCAARLWPADNARTWPVTGNVSVRP
jgi:hypothetical protein